MSIMREIVEDSLPIWQQCLETPFVQQMAAGTLDEEAFKGYIVDDTLYLKAYARVFALAMYKADRLADIRAYYSVLSFVQEGEDTVRVQYLKQWGLDDDQVDRMEMRKQNRDYSGYMMEVAEHGNQAEILMAVLPCMLSYYWLAERMKEQFPDLENSRYWPLISTYADEGYLQCCQEWGAFAEQKCREVSEEERQRLFEIFRTSSRHEVKFWEMSFVPRNDC